MSVWDTYPADYRADEVRAITLAAQAGESVSVAGLSGSGKSNLLGFLANRAQPQSCRFILVDCNRLSLPTADAFFQLIRRALGSTEETIDELGALDVLIGRREFEYGAAIALLLDRFDNVAAYAQGSANLFNNMRALRDAHKYRLAYVAATRRPLRAHTELAELFYAHTVWLGALKESDARWNVSRYAERKGLSWDKAVADTLIALTHGYPSFLRAACEAYADGATLDVASMVTHPAVKLRLDEFWSDNPSDEELRKSGVDQLPLLESLRPATFDTTKLTAKEHLLLSYFQQHTDAVCEKDDLIRAVWPEDQILQKGLRDDSLAQLVRRLREKIEPDPANPRHIHTVPGRGYRFTQAQAHE
jgi:energy-coupling factor transporter ATP-binding protein EcfA2